MSLPIRQKPKIPFVKALCPSFLVGLSSSPLFAIFGALISLLALLSPIRSLARYGRETRWMVSAGLGLLSFVASFGFWTHTLAGVEMLAHRTGLEMMETMGELPDTEANRWFLSADFEINRTAITSELWRRKFVPPPMRQTCYTPEMTICHRAGLIPDRGGWSEYLSALGLTSGAALTAFGLSWRFTRPKQLMVRPV